MKEEKNIKVGLGVMIFKSGKVLMGERKGAHGAGEFAFPGGHVEFGEPIVAAAKREVKEEVGIEIKNVNLLYCGNLVKYGKHYAQFGLIADWKSGEVKNKEKDRSGDWSWYPVTKLPKPFFGTVPWYLEAYETGKNFFDSK